MICDRLKTLRDAYHTDHSAYKLVTEFLQHRDAFTPPGDDSELALFLPRYLRLTLTPRTGVS